MNINDGDQPLGEEFLQNPYEYFQSFVRNMNNQVFLSEYQLNHLYALLLIRKQSPWDKLQPNSHNLKGQIEQAVNGKVNEVKKILQSLSQMYQDKLKKNTFTQLQRLMNILKARNKSIYIEKDLAEGGLFGMGNYTPTYTQTLLNNYLNENYNNKKSEQKEKQDIKEGDDQMIDDKNEGNQQQNFQPNNKILINQINNNNSNTQQINQQTIYHQNVIKQQHQNIKKQHSSQSIQNHHHQQKQLIITQNQPNHQHHHQQQTQQDPSADRQVLSLFYGIANIPNLSSLALGNCLQYSAAQRFIKFKMSKRYIMTIKNQDPLSYDRTSSLRLVPSDLYVHGIFPYLTAVQLFKARSVCKQWMENVKQAWHSTFKRQMFVQLMACEFCKQIEFYYKLIQLRNPFFQKISLLMHALVQIIQWDKLYQSIHNNTIIPQLKKVLIILLKLVGQNISIPSLNSITQEVWVQNKDKIFALKQKISFFLNNIQSSGMSILDLIAVKVQLLDDPFMRVQELNSQDKTPLLLVIFIKQLTLQQILKNHIYFSQEYLMKTKLRLDNISSKMPQQKGFLQGVYKIILLRNYGGSRQNKDQEQERTQMPNFSTILTSIFQKSQENKPDFVLKSKASSTNIYMDRATKFDIIFSTVKKMQAFEGMAHKQHEHICENHQHQEAQETEPNKKFLNEGTLSQMIQCEQTPYEVSKKFQTVKTCNVVIKPKSETLHSQEITQEIKPETQNQSSQTLKKNQEKQSN